jgi:two-component system, OmpR family, phosphate regulon sensor histidine kinase PhoR
VKLSIKNLYLWKLNTEMKKYQEEFRELRLATNMKICETGAKIILLINILLVFLDLWVYKPVREETSAYLYLYYSHIVVIVLVLAWLTFIKLRKRYGYTISRSFLSIFFINMVIYWCVFMSLNALYISGEISAFITGVLVCAAFTYMTPKSSLFIYTTALIVLIIGFVLVIDNNKLLYSHIVNSSIAVVFSLLISNISFVAFAKEFLSKRYILESKLKLETANHKLREYEKLRTDFFANISHEFKTPLNVIYSAQQMIDNSMVKEVDIYSKVNKYTHMIKQNCYRLIRLIGNLIDITKIDAASFEVDLTNNDIVNVVENITLSVAEYIENKGIELVFDTEFEEKLIACDPENIERMILNLLSNAVKFTEKDGSILVYIYAKDSNVCISVKDSGIGLNEDMKGLIFDRFIQVDKSTKRKREGSGIGLSLVKSLVEMHGGTITVESKLGEGSNFIISLPDKRVENSKLKTVIKDAESNYIERIGIEFSDIYE